MTRGQIQQLQDLRDCYISDEDDCRRVDMWAFIADKQDALMPWYRPPKAWLRKLTRQYRHQIAAIKRNQRAAA